jgi:hypothetical protein
MAILTTVRYEICAMGPFDPSNVRVHFDPSATMHISPTQHDAIRRRCQQMRSEGRRVENLPLYRVLNWTAEAGGLDLWVGPSCYEEYVGLPRSEGSRAPESLTVSAASQIDQHLVLELRSQQVAEGRGMVHVKPSGQVHPPNGPWEALLEEYWEELAILPDEIERAVCLGLVRSLSANCYSVIYGVTLGGTIADLLKRSPVEAWEHEQLSSLRCSPDSLRNWLVAVYPQAITGPGHASVLLWGRQLFGDSWYQETCRQFLEKPLTSIVSESA